MLFSGGGDIVIGFCDHKFPMQYGHYLGFDNNSIGIQHKSELWIDNSRISLGNDDGAFKKWDFIGIGIIHKPFPKMEFFATCNGKLLGKINNENI